MQTFWQRVHNYLQNVVVNLLVIPPIRGDQRSVIQKTGQSFRTYESGLSTSAAAIAVGDWALEWPLPLPPKIHVSIPFNSSALHSICHYIRDHYAQVLQSLFGVAQDAVKVFLNF